MENVISHLQLIIIYLLFISIWHCDIYFSNGVSLCYIITVGFILMFLSWIC